jgi:putative ABC transport system substrate-binding protein
VDVRIDLRSAAGHHGTIRNYATEVVALAPDLIIAFGTATVPPLQQATTTVRLIMVNVPDPVGAGFIESLARPGGNTTGSIASSIGQWGAIQSVAPSTEVA